MSKSKYYVIFDECSNFVYIAEEKSNGKKRYTMFDSVSNAVNYCNENNISAEPSRYYPQALCPSACIA